MRTITGHPTTDGIQRRLARRFRAMARELHTDLWSDPLCTIQDRLRSALERIADLLRAGRLEPAAAVRLGPGDPASEPVPRTLRLGVYPVNGNPLHWGHVLCGLEAVAQHELDRVAYVVQGVDRRKLEMSAATELDRHLMARMVLRPFSPLLAYSGIGLGNERVGEENLFELLRLNPRQPIEATYIVGGDHYRVADPAGNPDTLVRLEARIADPANAFDAARHAVQVLFVERGERGPVVPTRLPVSFVPEVLEVSSTQVRQGHVAYTPYEAFQYVRARPAYARSIGLPLAG